MDWQTFLICSDAWAWIRTLFIAILIMFGWRISTRIADRAAHRSEIRNLINEIMDLIHKIKSGFSDLQNNNLNSEIRKRQSIILFSYIWSVNVHIDFLKKYNVKLENDVELMADFLHAATFGIENPSHLHSENLEQISKLETKIRVKLEEAFFKKYKHPR